MKTGDSLLELIDEFRGAIASELAGTDSSEENGEWLLNIGFLLGGLGSIVPNADSMLFFDRLHRVHRALVLASAPPRLLIFIACLYAVAFGLIQEEILSGELDDPQVMPPDIAKLATT